VKQTVNFDEPSVYHLYYGDEVGTPGSVMTFFPFPHIIRGRPGTGEVGTTVFSVPEGSLDFWQQHLAAEGVADVYRDDSFGQERLTFSGPDGDGLALVEDKNDVRKPWTGDGVAADHAIRGFHSASLRLRDAGATEELLRFMGYEEAGRHEGIKRLVRPNGSGADFIDIETLPDVPRGDLGAGSVHHIAFAVDSRATQLEVRKALMDTGYQLTPVIDRDYFFSVYFRTPGGVLFEIATNEPGFDRDEDTAHLGEALKLPTQHEHLRAKLEQTLEPLE
jgi:glyoxalase family protein